MFYDLTLQDIVSGSIVENVPEIVLSDGLKNKLQAMFENENFYVKINRATSVAKPDSKYVFFSNHWFYLAVLCKKYALALFPYCIFFDNKIRSNTEITKALANEQYDNPLFSTLFDNEDDKEKMIKFIKGDDSFRPGKSLLNIRNNNQIAIRTCRDVFGSSVLKTIAVPDASSGYLGDVIYYLAKNPEIYDELEKEIGLLFSNQATNCSSIADNILFYGVPGSGKSYTIKKKYCDNESFMERVVFHPDYTYSDFVGQILPDNNDGKISYPFKPGPFTRILKKACADTDNQYYLIIEELNRGNAPAIFGEVFQLLDRKNGESEYGISNADIAKEVYGDPVHLVKIPANLSILATMNTADQNVFTLDTAFKRRWKMKSIRNDFDNCDRSGIIIGGTDVTWKLFATEINKLIVSESAASISSEDKRLGAYFAETDEITDARLFAEKVLAYLWDDVFKYDRSKLFDPQYETLEELIDAFVSGGINAFNEDFRITFKAISEDSDNS